ncbi:CMRF35-like molecule 9 isoform X1 [Cavia porcellus]|uniref:CMRF35-like molecule 9 isoform X1 n=1 Tax=Cavia porcellus TaxID=10141 RepID=UPI000661C38B|nr:CMRF35-like molecule 9 isoform X4 [Cavia porcellus]
MRALVLLWGCLALRASATLSCPKELSGSEGETVTLRCTYGEEQRTRTKYWCREGGLFISRCSDKIIVGEDSREATKNRVSFRDSPSELAFTVTLRDLMLKDSGKYWCGAQKLGREEWFEVSLTVFPRAERSMVTTRACCPLSPDPSFQALPATTASLQPRAGAQPLRPPTPRSSSPATVPDPSSSSSTPAGDPSPVSSSHGSMASMSIPTVRLLAPVLVLLSLLLAMGLITLGAHMFWARKSALLAVEMQRGEKVLLTVSLPDLCQKGQGWIHLIPGEGRVCTRQPRARSPQGKWGKEEKGS